MVSGMLHESALIIRTFQQLTS